MPDRLDVIAVELQRVGRWNAWAAGATCISALSQFLHFLFTST
jgi:hypothetical protein